MIPSKEQLEFAYKQVSPYIYNTPILTSRLLDDISGVSLFFKCENFQKMGAFKMRGAVNAILSLPPLQQQKGVVTHSSGNFGQAVALAAKNLGLKAYIVMPENAPEVKKQAVQDYGAQIILCQSTLKAREETSETIVQEKGATFLHPSNQIEVILGNATAGIELLQNQPNLDIIMAPVGGGGLIAGTALAAKYFGKNCKTIGGEPQAVNDAYRSLQSGKIEQNTTTDTLADGLKTQLGSINFPIITKLVDSIICVEEQEIIDAMRLIWERLKIIIEPSCAVPFAALLKQNKQFKKKQVGIILSGGNVDLSNLPF